MAHKLTFRGEVLGSGSNSASGDVIGEAISAGAGSTVDVTFQRSGDPTTSAEPTAKTIRTTSATTYSASYSIRVISTDDVPTIHATLMSLATRHVGKKGPLMFGTTMLSSEAVMDSVSLQDSGLGKGKGYVLAFKFTLIGGTNMVYFDDLNNGNFASVTTTGGAYKWSVNGTAGYVNLSGNEPYGSGQRCAYFDANGAACTIGSSIAGNTIYQTLTRNADQTGNIDYHLRVMFDAYLEVKTPTQNLTTFDCVFQKAGTASTWIRQNIIIQSNTVMTCRMVVPTETLYTTWASENVVLGIGSAGADNAGNIYIWNVKLEEVHTNNI